MALLLDALRLRPERGRATRPHLSHGFRCPAIGGAPGANPAVAAARVPARRAPSERLVHVDLETGTPHLAGEQQLPETRIVHVVADGARELDGLGRVAGLQAADAVASDGAQQEPDLHEQVAPQALALDVVGTERDHG